MGVDAAVRRSMEEALEDIIAKEQPAVVILLKDGDLLDLFADNHNLKCLIVNLDKGIATVCTSSTPESRKGFITMPEGRYTTR